MNTSRPNVAGSGSADAAAAEKALRRNIELEPTNFRLRTNLANFLRRDGRLDEAVAQYRQALQLAPTALAARHNLALTLGDLGRHAEAETECRAVIRGSENDPEAWAALGLILNNQNRLFEAEQAYQRALLLNPNYGLAHHNLGSLLAQMDRAEESLAALERAQSLGGQGFELAFSRGKALTLLYRLEEAERAFAEAVALRPRHVDAQLNLARLRYMRGDAEFARTISMTAAASPADVGLQVLLASVWLRAGRYAEAEQHLRVSLRRAGSVPQFRHLLAEVLREAGRLPEAENEALEAAAAMPHDAGVVESLVSILLSRGRPEDALPFLRAQRARDPLNQTWIAYQATAARILGQPLYRELFNYERLIRLYPLEPPPGWSSMAELNAALAEALGSRHRFRTHPLDQSLRHGSQTTRNLVTDSQPAIRSILRAFEEPIRSYVSELGHDPAHPLSARNQGAANIAAGWSVQLHQGGFHVNHYHSQGWLSSAYYVSVPDEVKDAALKSGWLKFGEPRFPTPAAAAERYVKPSAGLLVLFPSYMWHGTNAIHGPQLRTTIAFDAVPAVAGAKQAPG